MIEDVRALHLDLNAVPIADDFHSLRRPEMARESRGPARDADQRKIIHQFVTWPVAETMVIAASIPARAGRLSGRIRGVRRNRRWNPATAVSRCVSSRPDATVQSLARSAPRSSVREADRLRHVFVIDSIRTRKIPNRTRHPEHAVARAGREVQLLHGA